MKKEAWSAGIAIVTAALVTGAGMASDGAHPGDMLYGLDRGWEKAQVSLAGLSGKQAVAETYLRQADERLVEMKAVIDADQYAVLLINSAYAADDQSEVIVTLLEDYETALAAAADAASDLDGVEADDVLSEITECTLDHLAVLTEVYERVPDQAKDAIEHAMAAGAKGHSESLRNLSEETRLQVKNRLETKVQETEQSMLQLHDQGAQTPVLELGNGNQNAGNGGQPISSPVSNPGNGNGSSESAQESNANQGEDRESQENEQHSNQNGSGTGSGNGLHDQSGSGRD